VGGNDFTFDPILLGSVSGTVSLSDSMPNIYAQIQVIGANTVVDTTDDVGAYNTTGVMPGNINIIVVKDGYLTVQVDTSLANDGSDLNIDFMLYPGTNNFIFDFETDDGGFVGSGSWQWGTPSSGPGSAYSGTNAWATNLSGNYADNEHSELVTPELNLAGLDNPKLKFAHWYDMEEYATTPGLAFDGGNVKISTDGGSNFTLINPLGGYPYSISTANNVLNGQSVFSSTSVGWELTEFDLSGYANQSIVLKFDFGSDGSANMAGWYIDSVFVYNYDSVATSIGLEDGFNGVPKVFALGQNYPNPFNPVTTISYQLPKTANVKLEVYNMLGQKVKTLVNANQPAKFYTVQWNGLNEKGSKVASGIYLYRIEAGDFIKTNKMLLLK
jgi:immune inhibitor InhA-like protein/flagellar hook capping protein FlgD